MAGPANNTATRFHHACRHIARGSSSGDNSSYAVIPAMSQNPPSGTALSPYSIPPRLVDQTVGPKPTKNLRTFIPDHCATFIWPNSCSTIDNMIPRANRMIPTTNTTQPSSPVTSAAA